MTSGGIILLAIGLFGGVHEADTLLTPSVVSARKLPSAVEDTPFSVTVVGASEALARGVTAPKDAAPLIPGLSIPDYGSSMTSTIYYRGFGSRMENPVIGVYVDGVPLIDKNAIDSDFTDVSSIAFYSGSQGTLFGRNALAGVLDIRTGVPQGSGVRLEGGTAGNALLAAYSSWGSSSLSLSYRHGGGYFTNEYDGSRADPFDGVRLRFKTRRALSGDLSLGTSLSLSLSREGGFAYGRYQGGVRYGVNHNDECSYRRGYLSGCGFLDWTAGKVEVQASASFQLLMDRMRMDQDYLPASIFTLEQSQTLPGITLEAVVRPREHPAWLNCVTGAFLMAKHNSMSAPVGFMEDGVQTLILDNANAHIPEAFGKLEFEEKSFVVSSDFGIGTLNAALFQNWEFILDRWRLGAGLRLDFEGAVMAYDSGALVHYRLNPIMPSFRAFPMRYTGTLRESALELLPSISAIYSVSDRLKAYASLSRGYRAGGFNTQIFSDILQNRMMQGMMDDMGVHPDTKSEIGSDNTRYNPENAWGVESGLKYTSSKGLRASVGAFLMHCFNQQLTVFPPGQATGRMMVNAGSSLSRGVEAHFVYERGLWRLSGAGSYSRATFLEYRDGDSDYGGNTVPYAPDWTANLQVLKKFDLGGGYTGDLGLWAGGTGRIVWDVEGSMWQNPYILFGAGASLAKGRIRIYLRGENLLDSQYDVFYFKSMGNEFFSRGKPRRVFAGIAFTIN